MPYRVTAEGGLRDRGSVDFRKGAVISDEYYEKRLVEHPEWKNGVEKISEKKAAEAPKNGNGNGKAVEEK